MTAEVIEDAQVLIPNPEHKNFTRTNEVIPKGTLLEGEIKVVAGLKRGEPFNYNLFYTTDKKIIYIKYIKPMEKTEVTLGADGAQTPTDIKLPNTSNLGKYPIGGILVGALAGFALSKHKKFTGNKKTGAIVVGAVLGFIAGKYIQSKRQVVVKPSK
jgi:hypothetical protein